MFAFGPAAACHVSDHYQHGNHGDSRYLGHYIRLCQLQASCSNVESIPVSTQNNIFPIDLSNHQNSGTCQDKLSLTTVSYIVSAIQMATDWACALVPFFVVAGLQMSRRKKVSVLCILGLGVFASIATCFRMPFLKYYDTAKHPTETLCEFTSQPLQGNCLIRTNA